MSNERFFMIGLFTVVIVGLLITHIHCNVTPVKMAERGMCWNVNEVKYVDCKR